MNIKNTKQRGFTIIEVLIVLAIAGLIMLIVFLAIPALQRNQRNTARRSDASRLASATNDFITNSNGTLPTSTANANSIITATGGLSGLATTGSPLTGDSASPCAAGSLDAGELVVCDFGVTSFTALAAGEDGVAVVTEATCDTAAGTVKSGTARQIALVYTQETNGAPIYACLTI